MILSVLGLVPLCIASAVACWFVQRLLHRQALLLARFDSMERQLKQIGAVMQRRQAKDNLARFYLEQSQPAPPSGLTPGTVAPDFEFPDLSGVTRRLRDFGQRRLLLIYFNPGCSFCEQMLGDLAELAVDGAEGKPLPLVVAAGDPEAMRRMSVQHLLRCPVLLDSRNEFAARYQLAGTPSGYLIDESGKIASPPALGAASLLALAAEIAAAAAPAQNSGTKGKVGRGLETSRINRAGLKAGTIAPEFRLPRAGGGELALEDLRGRRVLLIFSDPECGPCNAVAPALQQLHSNMLDVQFVMISRRDEQSNLAKIAELGLTFPVALQRSWEISKLYGIFETPVGYLIDENGVIIRDVARGAEAIVALLAAPEAMATNDYGAALLNST